ncbi:MAG: RagB/SusD family nutrient uptake outer membrane protein [Marinilabiliales bacterium]|nr:MAG: RagB/SusD family nutrient uptake outer membrane protein [Marinilabiliales bacterium]
MKKLLIIITGITLFQIGCTNLDDVLYDRIPADEYTADPILRMSPIYRPMQDFLDWGGWWFAQELTGDGATAPTRAGDWDDGGKWRVLHQHAWDNNTEAVNSMWGRFYNGVLEANKFIEEMVPLAGDPIIDEAIAKARILRAYYFYLLIDNYGDVPFVTDYTGASERPVRNIRSEIYYAILDDIEESLPLVEPSASKTGVSRGMVFSLLTKLYLNHAVYTGNENAQYWQKAEAYADSVTSLGQYSLEADALGPFTTQNQNSPENIWVIPFHEDTYQGNNLHMRTLHYNSNLTFEMVVGPWNGFAVMKDHFDTYQDNDRRKDGFLVGQQYTFGGEPIIDQGAGGVPLVFDPYIPSLVMGAGNTPVEIRNSGARVVKFEIRRGAKDHLSNHFPVFRYADILLMKAEARIRQGLSGDEYVNMVRSRAIAGAEPWTDVTLEMLLEERGREMFWEGHRRQDLIRFGAFNRSWWEKPASSADRNIFPIPEWAVDLNPNLAEPPVSL